MHDPLKCDELAEWEGQLDSFDLPQRIEALIKLVTYAQEGKINLPKPGNDINLHCHTFYSYNAYGYSPFKFAWLARKTGLAVAGIIDFDVLAGVEEFYQAGRSLELKATAGIETRVFLPEFAGLEINSPGEPGICYHMGVGMPRGKVSVEWNPFLFELSRTASQRNRQLVARVNQYLDPVVLDYDQDVLPLTPAGNATERHICLAYARKARSLYPDDRDLAGFWGAKLGADPEALALPESIKLQNTIRAKTMKMGGVGYVQPDTGSFSKMEETNRFILAAGGIPTYAWLDGSSGGESRLEELLEVVMKIGVAAVNVIPDRNYTPGNPDAKLKNLYHLVEVVESLDLPLVAGTEMNSPGQKFVDEFASDALSPLVPIFLKGAYIIYGHSALQREAGMGYTSRWAKQYFPDRKARNEFYETLGDRLQAGREKFLKNMDEDMKPEAVMAKLLN